MIPVVGRDQARRFSGQLLVDELRLGFSMPCVHLENARRTLALSGATTVLDLLCFCLKAMKGCSCGLMEASQRGLAVYALSPNAVGSFFFGTGHSIQPVWVGTNEMQANCQVRPHEPWIPALNFRLRQRSLFHDTFTKGNLQFLLCKKWHAQCLMHG